MPVTTASAAVHITPVVFKTFLKHAKNKTRRLKASKEEERPQDDVFFDQAFNVVKAFIDLGTKNTIESLQAFTNTHVPAPYWAAVSPVKIPLSTCNDAADALIEWFGPEELTHVVGGERWWQVRGSTGVDAEWIAQEADIASGAEVKIKGKNLTADEANILRMEKLDTVMLYVHGGGYFWGSINTHRYQILRYAPQYPWPCPLQDVLAAYLYLIRPPAGAIHKAVPHSKIVFAGDSAGAGLCLAVLTILRDLGLELPAGAVLISPWVDLTHSFPSIMQNFETDIIPKHGFLAKPSTLWPVPTQPESGGRVVPTVTTDPPKPGNSDTLKASPFSQERTGKGSKFYGPVETLQMDDRNSPDSPTVSHPDSSPRTKAAEGTETIPEEDHNINHHEPKPPKVLMENPNTPPLELRSQIQMYAATEQLTHPLVSPILQSSLGNLPPLYILAGDGEVLRDEIIYLAHKAAHPADYPTRSGVIHDAARQKANVQKFTTPTNVRLQVFDGMCHVLTVFLFTKSAKYAYRSIAEFVKHVSTHDDEYLRNNPFPAHDTPSNVEEKPDRLERGPRTMYPQNSETRQATSEPCPSSSVGKDTPQTDADTDHPLLAKTLLKRMQIQTKRSPEIDDGTILQGQMVRERIDIHGTVRAMEPRETLQALNMMPCHIGIIKEAPVQRWNDGQKKWDARFAANTKKVLKQKAHYEAKAERLIKNALDQGFVHQSYGLSHEDDQFPDKVSADTSIGRIQSDRRWGPFDLRNEKPPATAIAGRRDTPEAVALLKKHIYHTAPVTHLTVPKLKQMDVIRAAFDPHDDPNKPPRQSVSEEQTKIHFIPIHGLRMWDGILGYFGKKSKARAANGINAAK
ncbi:hypothetical protein M413DRAFT_17043 [Hebeloma cylindrosporum]|uniref:Alpha/beta hydrolase fold-3 domain-containing protein n=1 Tax=Hebeloma cylindrosporum TaxID=76867 RepID=A0A0C3CQJ6_HEBCY|nr:hypothetical protein M413DRAFT_17043 [Hebeloma cylindrosporum h7]